MHPWSVVFFDIAWRAAFSDFSLSADMRILRLKEVSLPSRRRRKSTTKRRKTTRARVRPRATAKARARRKAKATLKQRSRWMMPAAKRSSIEIARLIFFAVLLLSSYEILLENVF